MKLPQDAAQDALNEGFTEGVKHLFSTLVSNLAGGGKMIDALPKFITGMQLLDEAHCKASASLETIFHD